MSGPGMRLVAVLVGQPRTVGARDAADPMAREFRSAIWKSPVAGAVRCGRLGLEGDAVADKRHHGGPDQAVLAYGFDHYADWRAEGTLGDVGPGAFGENLCIAGAREDDVCVGDVYAVGPVRVQVTKPRQPCNTLARRHQRATLVREVFRNGRYGWYLRVLEEGLVEAGQAVTLLERPSPDWPVRRVQDVMAERASRPDEAMDLARCAGLADDWRDRLLAGTQGT